MYIRILWKEPLISETHINERTRVSEVRPVRPGGGQVSVVQVEDALRLAEETGLDLVEVTPNAKPPAIKLIGYGKYRYGVVQKAHDACRSQTNTQLKKTRLRLKINDHDFGVEGGHVERSLSAGDKIEVMIIFRGREQSHPEADVRLLQYLAEEIGDLITVESAPRQDGRSMTMTSASTKCRADVLTEQREHREAERVERRGKRVERASKGQVQVAADKADEQDRRRYPSSHNKGIEMPKNKIYPGAKGRFRTTGLGKTVRERASTRHPLEHKSNRKTCRLAADQVLETADVKRVRCMLGI